MNLDWEDIYWKDPDGGTILLHGILPTVVFPNGLRPRVQWHGLGILASTEEEEVWEDDEEEEISDENDENTEF